MMMMHGGGGYGGGGEFIFISESFVSGSWILVQGI